jgi:hypothetical protein
LICLKVFGLALEPHHGFPLNTKIAKMNSLCTPSLPSLIPTRMSIGLGLLALGLCIPVASAQGLPNTVNTTQIRSDYANFYAKENLYRLGLAMGAGALTAQYKDEDISKSYQSHWRSQGTDDFSKTAKLFGEWKIILPMSLAASYLSQPNDSGLGEWGNRTLRGLAVGGPAVVASQMLTGASRPSDNDPKGAKWKPFDDNNGVSGHAFVGALPFLTLAQMHPNNPGVRYAALAASFAAPLSRLNDNQHYFSQIMLGWYFAHQSATAVSDSKSRPSSSSFAPMLGRDVVGVVYTRTIN